MNMNTILNMKTSTILNYNLTSFTFKGGHAIQIQ